MVTSATPSYDALTAHYARLHRLAHLQAIATWDQHTAMPAQGGPARAAAQAELAGLMYGIADDPLVAVHLAQAGQEPIDDEQLANLREMQRERRLATVVPEAIQRRKRIATGQCVETWRRCRATNDWDGFRPSLQAVVDVVRDEADALTVGRMSPYDALLDRYEPGLSSRALNAVFDDVRSWLPGLISRATAHQREAPAPLELQGPFPVAAQMELCARVARLFGFDFDRGRIDQSAHPFTGGVPEDVRVTTRLDATSVLPGLFAVIHELGHARYQQNLPRAWLGQPIGEPRSAAFHESQSLFFERHLGKHRGLLELLLPHLRELFGDQPAFTVINLEALTTRVRPGRIRVAADELTYPAHILIRTEVEEGLLSGTIEVADIPAVWDERMRAMLDIDTRGCYAEGPMQDIHWPSGMFGYFPGYLLGAMYAAQWFATMLRERPEVDVEIGDGHLAAAFTWLDCRIWSAASRWTCDELARRASGTTLAPEHLRARLESAYLAKRGRS